MRKEKYKIGLLIGRFQPFHNGHLYLIQRTLVQVERLIIGIGSSNVRNKENPLSYSTRKKMVETVFEKEKIKDRLLTIVAIPDVLDDNEWLRIVLRRVGKFEVVIGNNEWVNGIFKNAGIPIIRVPYFKRYVYEGKRIRKLMKEEKSFYRRRMPDYLIGYL